MADERSPVGGNAREVITALNKMSADLARLKGEVASLKGGRGADARGARAEGTGRARSTEATDRLTKAQQKLNAEEAKGAQRYRDETGRYVSAAKARENAANRLISQQEQARKGALQAEAAQARGAVQPLIGGGEGRLRNTGRLIQQVSQIQADASQQMRKHGALTTEFLQAAARGDATLSEFRFQIGATIAKFAGWTAASSAVFAVLGAVRELGTGALDSLNSVNLLSRVVTELQGPGSGGARNAASRGLSDASRKYNLPIGEVGKVAFEFAKVPQNDTTAKVLEAQRAALLSVKVGEVEAADSAKFLISIQQGLGLSSAELVEKFDQINQAQNLFGVNIRETESGVAKAGGAFRAAGGDFDTLLALITTASRVSGRSGEQIGTALQRSAGLVRRPINQRQLREFGIDPTQGISDIYGDAIKKSRGLGGPKRLQLATALSTPQLAPYLVGVLNNPDLYDKVKKGTSPGVSRGSGQRELDRQLKSAGEQLSRFLVNLQNLGAAMARLGAFDLFGLTLKSINGSIDGLTRLLDLIGRIAGPFAHLGTIAVQLAGALAVLRRFNVGAFAKGTGLEGVGRIFQQPEGIRGRRAFLASERNVQKTLADERERVAGQAGRQAFIARNANVAVNDAEFAAQRAQRSGTIEQQIAADRKLAAAAQSAAAAEVRAAELINEGNAIRAEIVASEARYAQASKMSGRQIAALHGDKYIAGPGQPYTGAPRTLGQQFPALGARAGQAGAPAFFSGRSPAQAAIRAEQQAAVRAAAERGRLATSLHGSGIIGRSVVTGSEKVTGGFNALRASSGKMGTGLAKMGRAAAGAGSSILSMFGPLEVGILGFIAMEAAVAAGEKHAEELDKAASARPPTTASAARRQREQAGKTVRGYEQAVRLSKRAGFEPPERSAEVANAYASLREAQGFEAGARGPGILSGRLNYRANASGLKNQINEAARKRKAGVITLAQFDAALDIAAKDAANSLNITAKGKEAVRTRIDQLRASVRTQGSLSAEFGGLTPTETGKLTGDYLGIAGSQGASKKQRRESLRRAGYGTAQLAAQLGANARPEDILKVNQAVDALAKGVQESAQTELQQGLLFARSQGDRNAAYAAAYATLNRATSGIDADIKQQSAKVDRNKEKRNLLPVTVSRGPGLTHSGDKTSTAHELQAQIKALDTTTGANAADLKRMREARAAIIRQVRITKREIQRSQFEDQQGLADAQTNVQVSSTGNAGTKLSIQLKRAGERIRAAVKEFGRGSKEALDAIAQQNDLLTQEAQRSVDLTLARGQLAAARSYSAGDSANSLASSIRSAIGKVRGNKKLNDPQKIIDLQTQLAGAEHQQHQADLDRISSSYDIRIAKAGGDPEAAARLAVAKSRALLNAAKGDERAGYLAQYYNDLRALDQAKVESANLEFELALSATTDPVKQASIKLQQATYALKHAHNKEDVTRAKILFNQAKQAQADAADEVANALFDLAVSRTQDPAEQANIKLKQAIYALRHAHGKADRIKARALVNDAKQSKRDAAEELVASVIALAGSGSDDPVDQAGNALAAARARLKFAKGKADRNRRLADIRNAAVAYGNAAAESRVDDLEFSRSIGEITAQQEIEGLKKILNLHNIGKQERKNILRRIKQLQHEGDSDLSSYELTVGDIKLPTVYEVKRQAQAAQRSIRNSLRTENNVNMTINVSKSADVNEVFDAIDGALGGSTRIAQRAAGY